MPADSSHTSPPTALLKHLDRVYEMARVLAPTEKRASKLVEATYRRAAQSPPPESRAVRAWLFRLLLQTYATRRSDAATTSSVSTMRRPADLLQDFRFQTAEDALQRVVPVAFALQPPREQLVLTLCDIVELNANEAAVVLDTEPNTLAEEVTAARDALWETACAELTPGEQRLVEEELPTDALLDALRHVVAPHLGPLPPRLRPAVATLLEHPRIEHEEDPDVNDISFFDADEDASPPPSFSGGAGDNERSGIGNRLQRFGAALLIIFLTGLAGYGVASLFPSDNEPPTTDLLQLSVQHAGAVQPTLRTNSATEAEQFVLDQLGRRIAVPHIEATSLSGVSIVELNAGTRVPAFVFEDGTSNQRITTYAYTYALLDRNDRMHLTRELRQQLQDEERINLQTMNGDGVLVWRKRDDIYVAVTKTDPRQVRPRITHSS